MLRMALVYYGHHSNQEDGLIQKLAPQYFIANTAHGLWGAVYEYKSNLLLQDVTAYQQKGVKIIGYLTGGYEGRGSGGSLGRQWYTLEMNRQLIRNMAETDHVDGVFIDETSAYPDNKSKAYLKELTALAHSYNLITWGNVGQDHFSPWFFTEGGFDFMHSTEQWHGQFLSPVQQQWGQRISITGFKAEYTVDDAVRLTLNAWQSGIAFCYISSNGYTALPVWFEEYAARLQQAQDNGNRSW